MTPHDFALLARDAYTAVPDIGAADSASRAIVRQTAAGLVVAFPGTDNAASWLADLDVLPADVAGIGLVHRGFWRAWSVIAPAIVAAIGAQPVTLVGHSLGAALAICAAAALTSAGRPPVAVYGFEPPRVAAGPRLALLLAAVPVYLFRNGNDLVPDVPPGWRHAAPLAHIGTAALPFPNIEDHAIDRVIAALAPATLAPATPQGGYAAVQTAPQ
ncbi:lipase family protein [Burkholderia gladioli]|uniref:lipase family protein n=1 Tax=Burkholderia gladioli TaxID=28095 RepID=UPI000CFF5837|nr:lipase [Burkholderia gladioli]PRE82322.1 lipase [Burkholderia gladioli]